MRLDSLIGVFVSDALILRKYDNPNPKTTPIARLENIR